MPQSPNQKIGRPRSRGAHQAILRATLKLVSASGFRAITMDQIASEAGVGKMTVYRRWPNKSALVMDALAELVGPRTAFPAAPRALDRLRKQLLLQARFFRGPSGILIRSLLAEAQSNDDLARAFREGWILPRRVGVINILQHAVAQGDLRADLDLEVVTDQLYGPIYYRLLIGSGSIDTRFIKTLLQQVLDGCIAGKLASAKRSKRI